MMLTGIFTLTPTHCGTGQAAGAVDLPIAREAHTRLPLLPATTLKGVARDGWFREWGDDSTVARDIDKLFGPRLSGASRGGRGEGGPAVGGEPQADPSAGNLIFLDGMLLALPVRSLTGGFRMVTSPLLIQRLWRIARAHAAPLQAALACPTPAPGTAIAARDNGGALGLEDLVYTADKVVADGRVDSLAGALGPLISSNLEDPDRAALSGRLVVVEDAVLQELACRATPVAARIVLKPNKTSANLWYEETLPSDCLFAAIVAPRPAAPGDPLADLRVLLDPGDRHIQIGGNATVGQGLCRWTLGAGAEMSA
jgi:CRISPR-associated protein Cmr4